MLKFSISFVFRKCSFHSTLPPEPPGVSLGDVTAHGRVQDWPSRERLGTRLLPEYISRIFGWMVRISEIQQFPEFLEIFLGTDVYAICRCLQIFESFAWIESAPSNFLEMLINLTTNALRWGVCIVNNPCSWCINTCSKKIQSEIIMQIKVLLRATFKNS